MFHTLHHVSAAVRQLNVVDRALLSAAQNARENPLIIVIGGASNELLMPGKTFRRRETSLRGESEDRVELIEIFLLKTVTPRLRKSPRGLSERASDILIHILQHDIRRHKQAEIGALETHCVRRKRSRHDGVDRFAATDTARQGSDGIERHRKRKNTVTRDATRRRLEPDDRVERRWYSARSPGVRTDSGMSHAVSDGDGRTRRRTTGDAATLSIPNRQRRAVMRIETEPRKRELGHIGAADRNEARLFQPANRLGIANCRRSALQNLGAGERPLSLDIKKIFDRDRDARVGRRSTPGLAQCITRIGGRTWALARSTEMNARAPSPDGSSMRERQSSTRARLVVAPVLRAAAKSASVGLRVIALGIISTSMQISASNFTPRAL